MIKTVLCFIFLTLCSFFSHAQAPKTYSSSEILLQLQKLKTPGSVLYIAAHPDDENTRLLAWLANEKKVRTGYLSITRGDGGQNLIGDEQGIDLGLIRTQELLSARAIDGAEQFFTRAYDFGYSKNPDETFKTWNHDKILHDVVWVIRKFRPDVIITRFPTTGEGGHGHHTASAILAGEAFDLAGDKTKFPEQLKYPGIEVWQPKRLLWNTFNFGGNNLTREDQLKIDVGGFNPLLGKSYGEIAAESRSRHKSQGFGVPAQRGVSYEYFATIKGSKPSSDLMEGIQSAPANPRVNDFNSKMAKIIEGYNYTHPERSVPLLLDLLKISPWLPEYKKKALKKTLLAASGIFIELVAIKKVHSQEDSIRLLLSVNNRLGVDLRKVQVEILDTVYVVKDFVVNQTSLTQIAQYLDAAVEVNEPYFLKNQMSIGSFNLSGPHDTGEPEINMELDLRLTFGTDSIETVVPVLFKSTDPVKGEIYEPIIIGPPFSATLEPSVLIAASSRHNQEITVKIDANKALSERFRVEGTLGVGNRLIDTIVKLQAGEAQRYVVPASTELINSTLIANWSFRNGRSYAPLLASKRIKYDHIPEISYFYFDSIKVITSEIQTVGKKAGYIAGAGDKIPEALVQLGYTVTTLSENEITGEELKKYDVIVTGVRAYNVHTWLTAAHSKLMEYVNQGGTLLVQYNTNNSIGPMRASIAPYPFTISRNRITDETAPVTFLLPDHPVLNFPNKITTADFNGWIQERSIYNAEKADPNYKKILAFSDPGEQPQDGSLIVADHGKGRFIYTGLVFFRELPAGVEGAYRLFANLVAKRELGIGN